MSNWITDFFKNRGIKKEAELTDQRTEYDRKMQSSSWIKEAMEIDEEEIATGEIKKFAAEEKVRTIEAAYEMGDDMDETLKKDREIRVKGLSDVNLAEMLTELALKFEGLPERWSVEIEKQKKYVAGNRDEAEKKLVKLLGKHTLQDWKEAFKKFEDEDGTKEPKGLYEPEFNPGKQNWDKKEDFEAPSDKEKTKAMEEVGTGHEEDKKAIGDEKLLEEQRKEASVKVATSEEAQAWISKKIELLINEGKSQEQAAAIAYSMAREKGYDVPEKKSTQDDEIVAKVSKEDTIKKVAEVDSVWKVIKDEAGQDVIARVESATNTKVSTEEEEANKINSSELH